MFPDNVDTLYSTWNNNNSSSNDGEKSLIWKIHTKSEALDKTEQSVMAVTGEWNLRKWTNGTRLVMKEV